MSQPIEMQKPREPPDALGTNLVALSILGWLVCVFGVAHDDFGVLIVAIVMQSMTFIASVIALFRTNRGNLDLVALGLSFLNLLLAGGFYALAAGVGRAMSGLI